MAVRATELPNPFTADVDVAPTPAMVRIFGVSDALLFTGYGGYPGVHSDECVGAMVRVARAVGAALAHPRGRVVFSGCGTSGRLSHCMARAMNGWLARAPSGAPAEPRFDYLLAGSDAALLLPQESVEDRPDAGVVDLEAWEARQPGLTPDDPVVVVGISCGLSATYVGSMLHAAMQRPGYVAVALGFNPVDAVASVAVDGWGLTFHGVLRAMLEGPAAGRCVVLNPVLGPETIAGSSRECEGVEAGAEGGLLLSRAGHTATPRLPTTAARPPPTPHPNTPAARRHEGRLRHQDGAGDAVHRGGGAGGGGAARVRPRRRGRRRPRGARARLPAAVRGGGAARVLAARVHARGGAAD